MTLLDDPLWISDTHRLHEWNTEWTVRVPYKTRRFWHEDMMIMSRMADSVTACSMMQPQGASLCCLIPASVSMPPVGKPHIYQVHFWEMSVSCGCFTKEYSTYSPNGLIAGGCGCDFCAWLSLLSVYRNVSRFLWWIVSAQLLTHLINDFSIKPWALKPFKRQYA